MATITKIENAKGTTYRAQIRKFEKGKLIYSEAQTFAKKKLAETWAAKREPELTPEEIARLKSSIFTFGDLIRKYELGYCANAGKTKKADIKRIQTYDIAEKELGNVTSEDFIDHAHMRLLTVLPQTLLTDFVWFEQVYAAAYPAWKIKVNTSELDAAIAHLRKHGMIHKSEHRERRPTENELRKLSTYFQDRDTRSEYPMYDIMWFAIHSSRRESEITRLLRSDNDREHHTGMVRDLKHPRKKKVNKRFKFTPEAWAIIDRQPESGDIIFPYNPKTIGAYFTDACHLLEIEDLHFHDLRHEATSRLFEAGYSIPEVQLFTLHESWDVLRRYVNLRPEGVVVRS